MERGYCMKRLIIQTMVLMISFLFSGKTSYAATPAGTEIKNMAVVVYTVGTVDLSLGSNETTLIVEEEKAVVSVVKSAEVSDQSGGNKAVSGSIITYTLVVTVAGNGTAAGVVITDPIPANTTYTAGTLKLNGAPLTDAKDADAGDAGVTTAGEVTVGLGGMTSTSGTMTITFDVKIN